MRRIRAAAAGPLAALLAIAPAAAASPDPPTANGFVLSPGDLPVQEIVAGGLPRDGIPALSNPPRSSAEASAWDDDEVVVGVAWNGEARAYPLPILVWHELVNDTLGGRPILVSYCLLCGTAMVFDRRIDGRERSFGVSGLLYRSDLLLYDRETESLWSQIAAKAVTGPSRGERLTLVRARILPWGSWRKRHPETTILTRDTGYQREYGTSPYEGYAGSERLVFPAPLDRRYHPKMPTVGLRLREGEARAYPAAELLRAGGSVADRFAGRPVRVAYDSENQVFDVEAPAEVEIVEGFWFAWMAFHPESSVYTAPEP
jgi:hypothetical protein